MTHIILDTNVIINYPEILSYKKAKTKLIVPDLVFKQILDFQSPRRNQLADLLNKAQAEGTIYFSATAKPETKLVGNVRVDFTDFTITGYAKYLQEQGNTDVILATDDKQLIVFASTNGIKTYNSSDLLNFFGTSPEKNNTISNEADDIDRKENWSFLINLILAILLLIGFVFFIRNFGDIIDKYSNILWIIFLVIIGFGLYEVRLKRRQLYGFVEIGFGILTLVIVFYPGLILTNWDFYLKIIAGLYVIVRGLDNLYIGSEKKRLGTILKKLFSLK